MRRSFLILLLFIISLFLVKTFAQIPTAADEKDVVKISTTLIQIDAVVTDKKRRIIKDLKADDFEIYENGKKQKITNFSFISTEPSVKPTENPATKSDKQEIYVPPPPDKIKPEQVRRTYAIVVDDLGLSFASSYFVKQALKKFIKEQMQDGDLAAVIRTRGGIGTLQSFTFNRQQLLAAINKIRWNLNNDLIGDFEPLGSDLMQSTALGKPLENANATNTFLDQIQSFRRDSISIGTFGALKYIINGMKDLPGRKSVILLSEGLNFYDVGNNINADIIAKTRLLTELANRESISFYPIDPRGLGVPMLEAADDTSGLRLGTFSSTNDSTGGIIAARAARMRSGQDSLKYIAEQTGGFAYLNQNNINTGLQRIMEDQKGYYLIGYEPDEETFDAKKNKFNKLFVKVKNPDLRIRYRSGFFGVTDEKIRNAAQTPQQQLNAALTSPFSASEISLDLYSVFLSDEKNKNFIRSFIYLDTKNLMTAKSGDNNYEGNFEFVIVAYGDNGTIVEQSMKNYKFQYDKKFHQQFLDKGLIYDLTLPLKKAGAYQVRVAVRDVNSGKVGSAFRFIEVPDIGKKKLTLSNLIVKNYSLADWKKLSNNSSGNPEDSNFFRDTTLRQFKRGTALSYSYIIFNAKPNVIQNRQLQIQTKLFYNGKMLLQSDPQPLLAGFNQIDPQHIEVRDAVTLGTDLQPGDYALQIIVFENGSKKAVQQSIDFEITE